MRAGLDQPAVKGRSLRHPFGTLGPVHPLPSRGPPSQRRDTASSPQPE
ncbi:MAG: hypothetical protein KTR25_16960 [Myxococcales bacterium]|nr:hypothetical protein [Myxococcales bacterium]